MAVNHSGGSAGAACHPRTAEFSPSRSRVITPRRFAIGGGGRGYDFGSRESALIRFRRAIALTDQYWSRAFCFLCRIKSLPMSDRLMSFRLHDFDVVIVIERAKNNPTLFASAKHRRVAAQGAYARILRLCPESARGRRPTHWVLRSPQRGHNGSTLVSGHVQPIDEAPCLWRRGAGCPLMSTNRFLISTNGRLNPSASARIAVLNIEQLIDAVLWTGCNQGMECRASLQSQNARSSTHFRGYTCGSGTAP
jgi:hypothetical protein